MTTSDPAGKLVVEVRQPEQIQRYRFALGITDFLLCRTCGVYVAATGLHASETHAAVADAGTLQLPSSACSHQSPEDLKAQTCPSHARARRVVIVGHESPGGAVDTDRSGAMDPTPTGKTRAAPSSAGTASGRAATSRPSR